VNFIHPPPLPFSDEVPSILFPNRLCFSKTTVRIQIASEHQGSLPSGKPAHVLSLVSHPPHTRHSTPESILLALLV
jgi:hypothetical protein